MLSGYYGYNNIGDEAILRALVAGIKQTVPNAHITVLSGMPRRTMDELNVHAIHRMDPANILIELARTDLFISGGGSLLQDVTSKRTIPYYLGLLQLAEFFPCKTCFLSQGVGPVNSSYFRRRIARVLETLDYVSVRDEKSQTFLQELGVENVELTADPVFFLQKESQKRIREILIAEHIPFNEQGLWLGVNLRPWQNDQKILDEVSAALLHIIDEYKINILLVPFHFSADFPLLKSLSEKINQPEYVHLIENEYTPEEILGICNQVGLLLGMRLHSLIFAARNKRPFVGISYDIKVDSFLEQFGMVPACHTENVDAEKIYRAVSEHIKRGNNRLDDEAVAIVDDLESSAWQAIVRVKELLSGS